MKQAPKPAVKPVALGPLNTVFLFTIKAECSWTIWIYHKLYHKCSWASCTAMCQPLCLLSLHLGCSLLLCSFWYCQMQLPHPWSSGKLLLFICKIHFCLSLYDGLSHLWPYATLYKQERPFIKKEIIKLVCE